MVYEDISVTGSRPFASKENQLYFAVSSDRFLSGLLDLLLVSPFAQILLSPIFKELKQLFFWGGSALQFILLGLIMLGGFVFILFCYQVICWTLLGATAGQKILRLRVCTLDGFGKIGFFESFSRGMLWWYSLSLLGIPFIGMFGSRHGLCLHDRASLTCVVTDKPRRYYIYNAVAGSFIGIGIACVIGLVFVLAGTSLSYLWASYKKTPSQMELGSGSSECEEILSTEPGEEWVGTENPKADWMLSMHLVGAEKSGCLTEYLNEVLWEEGEADPYAYLAKGFLNEEKLAIRIEYFNKVCEIASDSQACRVARLQSAFLQKETEKIQQLTNSDLEAASPLYLITLLNHRDFLHDQELPRLALQSLVEIPGLERFVQSQDIRNNWARGALERARGALFSSLPTLDQSEQVYSLAWLCLEERRLSCSVEKVEACDHLDQKIRNLSRSQIAPIEHAIVVDQNCLNTNVRGLAGLSRQLYSREAKAFTMALVEARGSERFGALIDIMKKGKEPYQTEAAFQLSSLKVPLYTLNDILRFWHHSIKHDLTWQRLGENLLDGFLRYDANESASQVAIRLNSENRLRAEKLESAVAALYFNKQRLEAYQLFLKRNPSRSISQSRQPASVSSGFKEIIDQLKFEFGEL